MGVGASVGCYKTAIAAISVYAAFAPNALRVVLPSTRGRWRAFEIVDDECLGMPC